MMWGEIPTLFQQQQWRTIMEVLYRLAAYLGGYGITLYIFYTALFGG